MTDKTTKEAGFRRYDHLERVEHPDVTDIGFGVVHVFPKIDGTNASVWATPVEHPLLGVVDVSIQAGSRTRQLTAEADNAGFYKWAVQSDDPQAVALRSFLSKNPQFVVYGEWLVPHTLKTYRPDAWRRFYVFDVWDRQKGRYLPFDEYSHLLPLELDVIHPLAIILNPSENQLAQLRDTSNTYLIADGAGVGEGIVLKNYGWTNKHGRQPWAKMVRNEFKESNRALFGLKISQGEKIVEQEIINALCTPEFIRKEFAKVVNDAASEKLVYLFPDDYNGTLVLSQLQLEDDTFATYTGANTYSRFVENNRGKLIPRFLGTAYLTFIEEEMRQVVKRFKNPVVDFGKLNKLFILACKTVMKELF